MATGVTFSPSHQSKDAKEIVVTFEDQQKINRFARLNARKEEINDEINVKKSILTNITDAVNDIDAAELEFDDEGDGQCPVRIMEGEVFVGFTFDSAKEWIEMKKKETEDEIDKMKSTINTLKEEMLQLKTALYAKFGKENINLESDES